MSMDFAGKFLAGSRGLRRRLFERCVYALRAALSRACAVLAGAFCSAVCPAIENWRGADSFGYGRRPAIRLRIANFPLRPADGTIVVACLGRKKRTAKHRRRDFSGGRRPVFDEHPERHLLFTDARNSGQPRRFQKWHLGYVTTSRLDGGLDSGLGSGRWRGNDFKKV